MVGHGGSSAGSYLDDPTSPIPSHCASIVATSTLRVNIHSNFSGYSLHEPAHWQLFITCEELIEALYIFMTRDWLKLSYAIVLCISYIVVEGLISGSFTCREADYDHFFCKRYATTRQRVQPISCNTDNKHWWMLDLGGERLIPKLLDHYLHLNQVPTHS